VDIQFDIFREVGRNVLESIACQCLQYLPHYSAIGLYSPLNVTLLVLQSLSVRAKVPRHDLTG
jgi:hypothetical protein